MVTALAAALLMPVAALAQEWQVYTFSSPGFTIQFPEAPKVENGKVKDTVGVSLPVTHYTVSQDRITYTLSVVDYSSTNADSLSTISQTLRTLDASGKVTANSGARVNGSFGRRLSINGADGSRSAVAIFFVDKHLYTAIGQTSHPDAIEKSADAIRFRDSLQFLGDSGGFGALFGGSDSPSVAKNVSGPGGAGRVRPSGTYYPKSDVACAGKSAGDSVQLETPSGAVAATCMLVAHPNAPPAAQTPDGR